MSHFNVRIPKRARGSSRPSLLEESQSRDEDVVLSSQIGSDTSFLSMLQGENWLNSRVNETVAASQDHGFNVGGRETFPVVATFGPLPPLRPSAPPLRAGFHQPFGVPVVGVQPSSVTQGAWASTRPSLSGSPTPIAESCFATAGPSIAPSPSHAPQGSSTPIVPPTSVRPSSIAPTPSQSMADVDSGRSQIKGKRPRQVDTKWSKAATAACIKHYEDMWVHVKKGNLRPKDWEAVTTELNKEVNMDYNCEQVRNKIDTLRKKYRKEKGKTTATGGVRSTWEYFELLDTLWSTTPRCVGIPGAFDSSDSRHTPELQEVNVEVHLEEGEEVDVEEDGEVGGHQPVERSSGTTNVDSNDASGLGVKAQKVKEPKRASLGTFARALGDGWKGMSDTMKYIEKETNA
ncbi:hypothetical protein L7F22_001288 [Adiantum nelumboides]|nr:hypothetical protein [Adiantum nelumboides]